MKTDLQDPKNSITIGAGYMCMYVCYLVQQQYHRVAVVLVLLRTTFSAKSKDRFVRRVDGGSFADGVRARTSGYISGPKDSLRLIFILESNRGLFSRFSSKQEVTPGFTRILFTTAACYCYGGP